MDGPVNYQVGALRESAAYLFGIADGSSRIQGAADEQGWDCRFDRGPKGLAKIGNVQRGTYARVGKINIASEKRLTRFEFDAPQPVGVGP